MIIGLRASALISFLVLVWATYIVVLPLFLKAALALNAVYFAWLTMYDPTRDNVWKGHCHPTNLTRSLLSFFLSLSLSLSLSLALSAFSIEGYNDKILLRVLKRACMYAF